MRILILNLRDHAHPRAGGAEVFTHEVAKRWVAHGHSVTLIASNFAGGAPEEVIDGIKVIRLGNYLTVRSQARTYYRNHVRGNCDVVVDEYTNIPFLAPQFVREPIIFLVHEVVGTKHLEVLPPGIGHLMHYVMEPRWYAHYRNVDTVTVSKSTRDELLKFGINKVRVVPQGLGNEPMEEVPTKEDVPTFLFVGLLKKANRADDCIRAFETIQSEIPDARLWIVGRGAQREKLEAMAKGLNVEFFGYVDEARKVDLMQRAHAMLVPGIREGWGMVITEANACGTPAIAYDIVGYRDAVRDGETGVLTEPTPEALARAAISFARETDLQSRLPEAALSWSRQFSWDATAAAFLSEIEAVAGQGNKRHTARGIGVNAGAV
ncbi:MAG: glycosyltransferase family 4 protein [Halobacteriota archaeon]